MRAKLIILKANDGYVFLSHLLVYTLTKYPSFDSFVIKVMPLRVLFSVYTNYINICFKIYNAQVDDTLWNSV